MALLPGYSNGGSSSSSSSSSASESESQSGRRSQSRSRNRSRSRSLRDGDGRDIHCRPLAELVGVAVRDCQAKLDAGIKLHGSCAWGLAGPGSDVDLLASLPLIDLLMKVRHYKKRWKLLEHIVGIRIPRLRLLHVKTGLELDIVEAARDPEALAKDEFVLSWLNLQQLPVRDFAILIRNWYRSHRPDLPREVGFPNSFLLLLTGFWLLAQNHDIHWEGCSTPPTQEKHGLLSAMNTESREVPSGAELYWSWLRWLASLRTDSSGSSKRDCLVVDLRSSPAAEAQDRTRNGPQAIPNQKLVVIEPMSGAVACTLASEHLATMASLASCDLQNLNANS